MQLHLSLAVQEIVPSAFTAPVSASLNLPVACQQALQILSSFRALHGISLLTLSVHVENSHFVNEASSCSFFKPLPWNRVLSSTERYF